MPCVSLSIFPIVSVCVDWFDAGKGEDPDVLAMDGVMENYWAKAFRIPYYYVVV